ncbi:hypothetical protein LTR95_005490 [Oleoguttula sp. CCFEE 5521]
MAPSTPPPRNTRIRTPPTPLHGPLHDNYEPFARRSTRTAAQQSPYGSMNDTRARHTTPPPTTRRARFSGAQLTSPPSSPASPLTRSHKTPKESAARRAVNGARSDSDGGLHLSITRPSVLPTPNKTPMKRPAVAMNAASRALNFQSHSPSDVMPTPRKQKRPRNSSMRGFDLYEDGAESSEPAIPIFTDANARVPELDEAEDNPFVGPRKTASSGRTPRRGSGVKTEEEREMEQAVARDEGLIYVFRGKKLLRRFESPTSSEQIANPPSSPDSVRAQRTLKRNAGPSAHRPLTRSSIKPRLLFPTAEPAFEVDEEALTDIEVPAPVQQHVKSTPRKHVASSSAYLATPPSTKRTSRISTVAIPASGLATLLEEEEDTDISTASPVVSNGKRRKITSPFDEWPRGKVGVSKAGGKKREAEGEVEGMGGSKRTRSAGVDASGA